MTSPTLSKSKLLSGLQCAKKLWREVHQSSETTTIDAHAQALIEAGIEVGCLARQEYRSGTLVKAHNTLTAIEETKRLIAEGASVIFEAAFEYDGLLVRTDILIDVLGEWELVEVKATKSVKDDHIFDAAIQYYAMIGAGIPVSRVFIQHLNGDCKYPDLSSLFLRKDVSTEVARLQPEIEQTLHRMQDYVNGPEPSLMIGEHCEKPRECQFKGDCWQHVPENAIFEIPNLVWKKKDDLIGRGILAISEIPDDYKISEAQRDYVNKIRSGEPEIDVQAIRTKLGGLTYPLAFLDFETDNPAIPRFDGCGPYDAFPYQFSLHVLGEDGKLEHHEYLHPDFTDPRRPLAEKLLDDLEGCGTIIAFNASVERGVLRKLADCYPDLAQSILDYDNRFFDLLPIFRHDYFHPGFKGSRSIKSILPVIEPELSYDRLDTVHDGTMAGVMWNKMIRKSNLTPVDQIREQLLAYCRLDTLGLVEIYKHLRAICK